MKLYLTFSILSLALLLIAPKQAIPINVPASSVVASDGSTTVPSIGFGSSPGTGFSISSGVLTYSKSTTGKFTQDSSSFILSSGSSLGFSSNADSSLAAADTKFTRAAAGIFTITSVVFANLGTPANGSWTFCSDCTVTTAATCPGTQASCICAASGTGAFARRVNGNWYCTF